MKNLGLRFVLDQCYYFKKKHGKDIRKDNRVIDKLRREKESERAKRALNTQYQDNSFACLVGPAKGISTTTFTKVILHTHTGIRGKTEACSLPTPDGHIADPHS
ncbi:hypothetical protein RJT34_31340 [Clitoria ternatea]|uniref:Uncharacterized protein n=1 Tax=Clitoria ternatea TaxID=43366 RepID=A0AAN9EU62_CLITE